MNYYGAKELAASFRTVRNNTIAIAEEIPEDKYGFRVTPENRSVAQTLVHLSHMPRLAERIHFGEHLTTLEGFDFLSAFSAFIAEEQAPPSKAALIEALREGGERFAKLLEGASDELLAESVAMMPGATPAAKSRFEMLLSVKEHEMHHRSQLMVIERMIGIVPHLTRDMMARIAQMKSAKA